MFTLKLKLDIGSFEQRINEINCGVEPVWSYFVEILFCWRSCSLCSHFWGDIFLCVVGGLEEQICCGIVVTNQRATPQPDVECHIEVLFVANSQSRVFVLARLLSSLLVRCLSDATGRACHMPRGFWRGRLTHSWLWLLGHRLLCGFTLLLSPLIGWPIYRRSLPVNGISSYAEPQSMHFDSFSHVSVI